MQNRRGLASRAHGSHVGSGHALRTLACRTDDRERASHGQPIPNRAGRWLLSESSRPQGGRPDQYDRRLRDDRPATEPPAPPEASGQTDPGTTAGEQLICLHPASEPSSAECRAYSAIWTRRASNGHRMQSPAGRLGPKAGRSRDMADLGTSISGWAAATATPSAPNWLLAAGRAD